MKEFIFNPNTIVPSNRLDDVKEIRRFIIFEMNIQISLQDTYLFWDRVSDDWDAGWLSIDAHYEGMSREEFILIKMREHGHIIGDDEHTEEENCEYSI